MLKFNGSKEMICLLSAKQFAPYLDIRYRFFLVVDGRLVYAIFRGNDCIDIKHCYVQK